MADTNAQDTGQVAQPPPVTDLDDSQERLYRAWMDKNHLTGKDGMNVDSGYTGTDYDMRGYFKDNGPTDVKPGQHFPDTYKLPNHPTFSKESRYAVGENADKAGTWDDKGNFVPPMPEVTVTAKGGPQPEQEDLDYLKANPSAWKKFQQHFGDLPNGFTPPKPSQADIDYVKANPDGATQQKFKDTFGEENLPQGVGLPKASWSDVGRGAMNTIGAGEERMGAAAQEAYGTGKYDSARKQFWQALVLPDAVQKAKEAGIPLTEDPGVVDAAKHLGIRPDQFTQDWPSYVKMKPDEQQAFIAKQRDAMQEGAQHMNAGQARRAQVAAVEKGDQLNLDDSKTKSFALNMAQMAPEMMAATAVSLVPGGAVPAAAMLAGDTALRSYSTARDAGLDDQRAKLYGVISGAAMGVPEIKVLDALSKAPGANMVIENAVGKAIASSGAGKAAGTALNQGITQTVITALQQGIDKGFIDKNMSLGDALKELGNGFLTGSVMGTAMHGVHAGVNRAVNGPAPKTPAELEDARAHGELMDKDAQAKADAATEKGANAPEQEDPVATANEQGLRALLNGEQLDPKALQALTKQGLVSIGKTTGAPMVLPAGRRALADIDAKRAEIAKAATASGEDTDETKTRTLRAGEPDASTGVPADQGGGAAAPRGGEAADDTSRAPRTPGEAEDAAGAEARRSGAFDETKATDQAARQADEDRAYADRDARAQKGKDADYGKAKTQLAEETLEQAPHVGTEDNIPVTMKDAMDFTEKRAADVAATIPRAEGLSPEEREIESRFVTKIASDPNAVIEQYKKDPETMGGKVISADSARKLSDDYVKDNSLAQEIHEPASWLANIMFRRALAAPLKPGEDNLAVLLAGAPASGKSSTLERMGPLTSRAQVIFDAVMSSPESALDKIETALKAGKWVSVPYVFQDPRSAFKNSLLRAMATGRSVPAHFQKTAHEGSPEAMRQMLKKYSDDPRVQFVGIDNSLGDGKSTTAPVEELMNRDSKLSMGTMRAIAKEFLNEGKIDENVYERTMGEKAPASSARDSDADAGRGDVSKSEQEREGHAQRGASDEDKSKLDRAEARGRRRFSEEKAKRARLSPDDEFKLSDDTGQPKFKYTGEKIYSKLAEGLDAKAWNRLVSEEMHGPGGLHVSLHDLLNEMVKASDDRIGSTQDRLLSQIVKAVRSNVPDLPVKFVHNIYDLESGLPIHGAAGMMDAGGSIQVKTSYGNPAEQLEIILHEAVHAATEYVIRRAPDSANVQEIEHLRNELVLRARKKFGAAVVDAHIDHFRFGDTLPEGIEYSRELYGISNVSEMMAEVMSNPKFRQMISELDGDDWGGNERPEPKGIWERIVDTVAKIFDVPTEGRKLLESIMTTTGDIMEEQKGSDDVAISNLNRSSAFAIRSGLNETLAGRRFSPGSEESGEGLARDLEDNKVTKLVNAASELGALKMVRGITRFEEWSEAMLGEFGKGLKPQLEQLYQLAKDKAVDVRNMVYKTTKAGNLVGGPQGNFKRADIAPMRATLRKLAREGEFGKDWYKESSDALLAAVGGNKADAKKLAGLFSIFSAGATVDANTTMALRAWYQYKAGKPIEAGTLANNETAQRWLDSGREPTGMKRSNFYGNLLQSLEGDKQRMYSNGVTVDRWMMRALGYTREAPTDAQYAFVAEQIRATAKKMGWSPEQMQAAVWIAIKTRWETVRSDVNAEAIKKGWIRPKRSNNPKATPEMVVEDPERYYGKMLDKALATTISDAHLTKSASNFRTELLKHRAQVSWEAMPGVESGRLRGAADLPVEALAAFQRDVSAAHANPETGSDEFREALGLLGQGRINGNSAWFRDEGQVLRFRHWGPEGLKKLDPAKQGTGAAGQISERNRDTKVTALYPYDLTSEQPEQQVAAGRQQYVVEVPAEKMYDASRDPRGYKDASLEPISFDHDGEPLAFAYNHDNFEKIIKRAGFSGYYVSDTADKLMAGQARMFSKVVATPAEKYVEPPVETYAKAGAQDVLYTPFKKAQIKEAGATLDPNAKSLLESYAAALGKVNNQDSVGWHRPRWGVPLRDGNGLDVKLAGADQNDFMRAYKAMHDAVRNEGISSVRAAEFAPIQTPEGMRFVNWGVLDNRRFQELARNAINETFPERKPGLTHFAADGGLIHAADYDSIIAGNGHTDLLSGPLASVGKRVESAYREFAERHGLQDSSRTSAGREGRAAKGSSPISLDQLTTKAGLYENVMSRFGRLGSTNTLADLKVYDLKDLAGHPERAADFAKRLGFGVEYFSFEADPSKGIEFRLPRLGKSGYEGGKLWVYDPRVGAGSFYDTEYTRAWRISHELGHALTEPFLTSRYGDSRRYGRLGQDMSVTRGVLGKQREVNQRALTLAEAQRAVEWEDAAFRAQRIALEKLGVSISDTDFAREYNTNLADALYRVLSGDFGDPGLQGFVPSEKAYNVRDALVTLASAEKSLALAQGREPTAGIDLDSWRQITDGEIRQVVENRLSGRSEVKFSVRPEETVDHRVVAKDRDGNEVAGEHSDLQFANKDDAADHIMTAAEARAQEIGGTTSHQEGWSEVRKGGKIDRTYTSEAVQKDPYKNQLAAGKDMPGAAGRFLKEFAEHAPETGIGERLVNGNVVMGIVSDPINDKTAYVSYVRSITPGKGEGTRAMRDMVGMADKHGVALELNAVPLDAKGLPDEALTAWYKKLGFEPVTDDMVVNGVDYNANLMRREPKTNAEPVPAFATNAGKGISAAEAQQVLDHAKKMFPQAQHHLLESIEDAPHDVQAVAEVRGVSDRVSAVYTRDYDGTHVYLIRNNTESVAGAVSDMIHENVGHDGISKTFGPKVGALMDGFLRNDALRTQIARIAKQEGIDLSAAKDPLERKEAWRAATEEWLAHAAGNELRGMDNTARAKAALSSVISEIKVWAATHGLPVSLNQKDALTVLNRAHRYVSTGNWVHGITEQREAAEADRVKFAVVPKSGNADLDELLNDKIGAPKVGWRTRLQGAMTDIRSRLVTSALDRMNRVKEYENDLKVPAAESGYLSMRLSTNVAPLLRNMIEFGHLKWTATAGFDPDKSMAPDFTEGRPLNRVLAPLHNDPAMLRRFEGYLVALRAKELAAQGRENLLESRHIAAGLDLARQYPHFVQMQKDLAALNKNVLDFATKAGVIDPESRKMWESDYYVPFYRVTDDSGAGPWSAGSLAKVRNPVMRLMGSKENLNDITGNVVRNWSTLINASIKAHAVRVAVDNLSAAGVAVRVPALERAGDQLVSTSEINKLLRQHGITGALSPSAVGGIQKLMSLSTPQGDDVVQVWRGGKREYYRLADPALATAFAALKGSPLKSLRDDPIGRALVGAATMPKMLLTKLTTENPAFGVRTLWKDNINAWSVGRGMMPVTPVVSAITGLKKTMEANGAFKRMAAAGATFNAGRADPYDTNLTAKRYMTAPSLVGRLWDGYRNMMLSGENASRVTIYERTEKETGSHKLAAYEARDLMDYAMRGSSPIVQFMVETVPFWGAHVQGLYKTGRALSPDNSLSYTQMAGQAAKRIAPLVIKGTILSMLASALYTSNRNNPDYNDLPDIQKELYYHLYLGNYHIKIPKAFETGTVFGTVPEAITESVLSGFDKQTLKEQGAYILHAFGAALNLYPRVTAVTPLYELQTNKDLATGYPILSEHDQGVMPGEQVGANTSPVVTAAARAVPEWAPNALQSPKQFQHLLQGYFGIMGSYALNAADFMYRQTAGLPAPATRNLSEIPVVGSFVGKGDEPPKSTKSLGELSTVMIAANQLSKTVHDLNASGSLSDAERARKVAMDHLDTMIAGAGMKPSSDAIHQLQAAKREIQLMDGVSAEDKQAKVNEIQKKINEIARGAYEWRPGGKLNRQILDRIGAETPPAAKATELRKADMPALASIAIQYGKGLPPRVQAAIEELG